MTDPAALEAALLAAHAAGDKASLAMLYAQAAEGAEAAAMPFFLTQAYILALDAGAPTAADLRARLVALGRETA